MSSSDYTNLRRIRHVYYPSLNNCHSHTQPIIQSPPQPNHCYIYPHCHQQQQPMPVCQSHPITTCQTQCHCTTAQPSSVIVHPHMSHAHTTDHSCNNCNHSPQPPCIQEPTNVQCSQMSVSTCGSYCDVPDKSSMSVSIREYLLSPNFYGSTTFRIDCYLGFRAGMKVNCMSDLSSNNYFEGEIYDYHASSGEITVHKLASINGDFTKPSKYIVSIIPAFQELDLLRERMAKVYLELFGIDISGPRPPTGDDDGGQTVDVTTENTQIKNLYNYFFGEDITTESGYGATTIYLTTKINSLYTYFFDIDLSSTANSSFNPNGNNVSLDSLSAKVQQLNLYFFGNTDLTSLSA